METAAGAKTKLKKAHYPQEFHYASWDKKNKKLDTLFDLSVIKPVNIERAIANTGYDTQHIKTSNCAYNGIRSCCQYQRIKTQPSNKIK